MLKVLELFGGIGACTAALKRLEIDFKVIDYVEVDKYAVASYNAINNTNFEPQDICKWAKDIEVDLIMHGSPCQDFSIAGKQAGGNKDSGTRSSLMYETIRIVDKLKPKFVIWENVKNVLSKKHIHNFESYLKQMEDMGYKNYYQVLNAKDYGIPQNRERVFIVSILENEHFEFPLKQELQLRLKDMLENEVDGKYYIKKALNIKKTKNYIQWDNSGKGYNSQQARAYFQDGLCPTIATTPDKAQVLLKNKTTPKVIEQTELCIRKLTPKESWRLMGFEDTDFEKATKVNSNTQLYKQAGNSIVVNVLVEIFSNLFKVSKRK